MAWRAILGKANFSQTFWVINEGYMLNNILPSHGRDRRGVLLGQLTVLADEVFSGVIIERAFDGNGCRAASRDLANGARDGMGAIRRLDYARSGFGGINSLFLVSKHCLGGNKVE